MTHRQKIANQKRLGRFNQVSQRIVGGTKRVKGNYVDNYIFGIFNSIDRRVVTTKDINRIQRLRKLQVKSTEEQWAKIQKRYVKQTEFYALSKKVYHEGGMVFYNSETEKKETLTTTKKEWNQINKNLTAKDFVKSWRGTVETDTDQITDEDLANYIKNLRQKNLLKKPLTKFEKDKKEARIITDRVKKAKSNIDKEVEKLIAKEIKKQKDVLRVQLADVRKEIKAFETKNNTKLTNSMFDEAVELKKKLTSALYNVNHNVETKNISSLMKQSINGNPQAKKLLDKMQSSVLTDNTLAQIQTFLKSTKDTTATSPEFQTLKKVYSVAFNPKEEFTRFTSEKMKQVVYTSIKKQHAEMFLQTNTERQIIRFIRVVEFILILLP